MKPFKNICTSIKKVTILLRRNAIIRAVFPMDTAYFRHLKGDPDLHVTFRFKNSVLGVDKQLNFCRKVDESCAVFLNRVNANVSKLRDKKRKRKAGSNVDDALVETPVFNAMFVRNDNIISDDTPLKDILKNPESYVLCILESRWKIAVNAPWIETITLPTVLMAGFEAYPSKFDSYFVDKSFSVWTWFRSSSRGGPWRECSREMVYTCLPEDVGSYLKVSCLPKDKCNREGPQVEDISQKQVSAGPGALPFQVRHAFTSSKVGPSGFRSLSYNILADLYVDSEYSRTVLFGYCPFYALEFAYRKQILLKELTGYNADLLCLQEVDLKLFRHDLVPMLGDKGLVGEHSQKGLTASEGTAVFFSSQKFRSLRSWRVVLGQVLSTEPLFSNIWEKIKEKEPLVTRVTKLGTSLQAMLLESLTTTGQLILVGNTHLYFHPDADHIRLLQGILVTIYMQALLKEVEQEFPRHKVSLLLCGDFNSVPECGIYQLLTTGQVDSENIDWKSNEEEAITGVSYSHSLRMASACGTPIYTNYTPSFKACIDYIFYQTDHLAVTQVIPSPSEHELAAHSGIPSVVFPSDHLALISDLEWIDR